MTNDEPPPPFPGPTLPKPIVDDTATDAERDFFSGEELPKTMPEAKRRRYHLGTLNRQAIHRLRLELVTRVFRFVCLWVLAVFVIIIFAGVGLLHTSDNVLIAILGTTTLNIIGLLAVVVRHLFPQRKV